MTMAKTKTKTNTFWEHLLRAILETCDLWDIWSEWWEDMTWPKKIFLPGCGEYKFSIRTNIRIYLYPKNDTNEYQNIFVSKKWYELISEYIRIKKTIRTNTRIYSYRKNDTNMIRTNIRIGKYSNVRIHSYKIFDISFRFDARCWIFDVWYNRKLKHIVDTTKWK